MSNFVFDGGLVEVNGISSVPLAQISGREVTTADYNKLVTVIDDMRAAFNALSPFYNVKRYGAVGNGTTDDWAAIQQCIDAAIAAGGAVVYFPAGDYLISKALQIYGNAVHLLGEGRENTIIKGDGTVGVFNGGPMLIMRRKVTAGETPLEASLVSGIGKSFHFRAGDELNRFYVDFTRDQRRVANYGTLNGNSQISVGMFYKAEGAIAQVRNLLSAQNVWTTGITASKCFSFQVLANGALEFKLNIGGTLRTVTSSAGDILTNTLYYVLATYDGDKLRVFRGAPGGTATKVGESASFAGTVVHDPYEEHIICGPELYATPAYGPIQTQGPMGWVDNIMIANLATATANFTAPSTKLVVNGDHFLLCNFDMDGSDQYVVSQSALGLKRNHMVYDAKLTVGIMDTDVEHIGFTYATLPGPGGVYCSLANHTRIRAVALTSLSDGIAVLNNSFESKYEDIRVSGGACGIMVGTASGVAAWRDLVLSGNGFGILSYSGIDNIDQAYFETFTKAAIYLDSAQVGIVRLTKLIASDEGSGSAPTYGMVCIQNASSVKMDSSNFIAVSYTTKPLLWLRAAAGSPAANILLEACLLSALDGTTERIKVDAAAVSAGYGVLHLEPAPFQASYGDSGTVPWTTSAAPIRILNHLEP